jgi:4-hydroxybenzoyl-CoA thioesterase
VPHVAARVTVAWGDCDPAGIVFYPRFQVWMDTNSHLLAREMGITRQDMLPPNPRPVGLPLVAIQTQFLAPARMDDVLEVRTWVGRVGRSSLSLRHEIERVDSEPTLLVRGREDRVYVGQDELGTMRPRELTPHMRTVLARFADPPGREGR